MRSRIGKRPRQFLIFLHVAVSVGWMGAGAANVVLALTAAYTPAADVRRVCYVMIEQIDVFVVIPLAFAALISGVLLCLVTPWGLTGYWWVLAKLVLTVAVIVFSTFGLGVWVEESVMATTASTADSEVARPLAYGAVVNIVAFLFMTWVSVVKPWGRAPWARTRPRGPDRSPSPTQPPARSAPG